MGFKAPGFVYLLRVAIAAASGSDMVKTSVLVYFAQEVLAYALSVTKRRKLDRSNPFCTAESWVIMLAYVRVFVE
ncbi:hypothetical protein M7I_4337 [Glarea lozoyensis 74030]|uniref:Uncharacterized protein n=1 Tax=Glarea lozoyensis (strain ATCC 74030 / MF5533) TaxID=1104152 RepID=H0ENX3_GLAL7|nr:hypothetical protein M7I_4337 [Glarea lozoyensis 74030]